MVRELHVVTLSADGRELLLGASPDGRPTHSLLVDVRLSRALRGEDPDGVAPSQVALTPREMQARLRAGATVDEVAAEAGVPVARVERFAGPVRSEQEQVVGAARQAVLRRARAGRSDLPLADAVAANLGVIAAARLDTASWHAAREADGRWVVSLHVVVRGRLRIARWRYDAAAREVTSLDAYAAQLGFVDAEAAPRPHPTEAAPVRSAAPKKAAEKVAARPTARKPAAKKPAAKKPAAKKPAAKKQAAKAVAGTAAKKAAVTRAVNGVAVPTRRPGAPAATPARARRR